MPSRRELLLRSASVATLLATSGLLPAQAQATWNARAFDAGSLDDVLKALGAARPVESPDIAFTVPDIAENGAVVPIGASTALSGLQRIVFMVEKNPTTLAGVFEFTDAIEPRIATRIKMAETSNVVAAAIFADGRVLFSQREVKVTLGGCGG